MTTFYVDRKNGRSWDQSGCYGLEVGGKKYDADSRGRVVVDNPAHAARIRANNDLGLAHEANFTGAVTADGKHCKPCRFVAYKWQSRCPKCGGELEEGIS